MKTKFVSLASSLFFIGLFLSSCTNSANKSTTADGAHAPTKLRVRIEAEPPDLDWTTSSDNLSRDLIISMQDGLLRLNKEAEIEPALAESWTVSPDGKTYTFKLRPNTKWSDGQPVVAQQFVDAIERTLNPSVASEYSYFVFDILNGEDYFSGKLKDFSKVGVKAPDASTVVYTLRAPAAFWLNVPSFTVTFPIRKDLIEKYGEQWKSAGKLVTTGPYALKTWERESKIVLVKNPHFWNPQSQVGLADEVEYRVVKENSVAVTMFDGGEVDIIRNLPPLQVPMLAKGNPGFTKSPQYRTMAFGMGTKHPLTKDVRVRKALAMSVDRSQIKKFMSDMAEPVQSWVPSGLLGSDPNRGLAFNPEEAKKIWATIKNPPNKGLEYWYPNDEKHKMMAEFLQSEWKKNLGIEVTLVAQEWKVFLKSASTQNLPIFRQGWGADYPDSNNFLDMYVCKSGNNYPKYCSPQYEELLTKALNTQNSDERAKIYAKAEKMLIEDDVALAPIFQENNIHLVNPTKIQGFHVNKMGEYRLGDLRYTEK